MTFTVAIVGLGRVGLTYDVDLDAEARCLSHSQAFAMHPRFSLAAGVDLRLRNRELSHRLFGVPTFASVAELAAQSPGALDVVVIATPPDTHGEVLDEAVRDLRPRVVLLEKPAAQDATAAHWMTAWADGDPATVVINYPRRVTPGSILVRDQVALSEGPTRALCRYAGDLLTQGIHMIDLCEFWFGALLSAEVGESTDRESPNFSATFEHAEATFAATGSEGDSDAEFSAHVMTVNREWTFDRRGDRRVVSRRLGSESDGAVATPIGFELYQFWVVQEIEQLLGGARTNLTSLRSGLRQVEIVGALISRGSWP